MSCLILKKNYFKHIDSRIISAHEKEKNTKKKRKKKKKSYLRGQNVN